MQSSKCVFSVAAALNHVFIAPIEHFYVRRTPIFLSTKAPKLYRAYIKQRSYASLPTAKRRLARDDEITYQMVRIVSDDQKLSPPQYTSSILNSIDQQTQTLVMVALPSPSDPEAYPICKIQSKQALREAEKAQSKRKEAPSATVKTMELNWAIDPHDLKHRLEKLKDFLSKGFRVDVVMAGKKKGRKATLEEAEAMIEKVREAMKEVAGSKEWRAMEGKVGGTATLHAEGKLAERE